MSNESDDYYLDWNVFNKAIDNISITKKDILIALTHFVIVSFLDILCLGIGECITVMENEIGSKFLPDYWNKNSGKYTIRYIANDQIYLLLGYSSGDCFILNFLDVETQKTSCIVFEPERVIRNSDSKIAELGQEVTIIAERIRKELVEPIYTEPLKRHLKKPEMEIKDTADTIGNCCPQMK